MGRPCIGNKRNAHKILVTKPEGKNHYEPDIYWKIILKLMLEVYDGRIDCIRESG
jgi:hypothetical protein